MSKATKTAAAPPSLDEELAAALAPWVYARWHSGPVERAALAAAKAWLEARAK